MRTVVLIGNAHPVLGPVSLGVHTPVAARPEIGTSLRENRRDLTDLDRAGVHSTEAPRVHSANT